MKKGKIYKITNKVNGKIYVGQTVMTLRARLRCHGRSKACILLKRAIDKYGIENFTIEEIETTDNLSTREAYWINCLKSSDNKVGYNIRGSSENVYTVNKATRLKLRESAIRLNQRPPLTDNSSRADRHNLALIKGFMPFIAYKKDGSYQKEFVSSGEAAMELGVDASHIRKILRGTGKSLRGYFFLRFGHESPIKGSSKERCQGQ